MNTNVIPRDLLARQNTHVSRGVQDNGFSYRKDLTDVFDCHTGNIKVNIPISLFDGTKLIDDPALVIEKLLLEAKVGDEGARPNDGRSGVIYSLVDVFEKENTADENHTRLGETGRPSPRQERQGSRNSSPKSIQELPTLVPPVLSYPKIVDPQQLLKMQQNGSNSFFSSQSNASPKTWSSHVPAITHLPLFQAMYNSSMQANGFTQSDLLKATSRSSLDQSLNSVGSDKSSSDASESYSDEEVRKMNVDDYRQARRATSDRATVVARSDSSPVHRGFSSLPADDSIKVAAPMVRGLFTAAFSSPIDAGKLI